MNDIIKIVKSLEECGLLIKSVRETIKGRSLSMLWGTLAASILRSALTRRNVIRAGEGMIRPGENF